MKKIISIVTGLLISTVSFAAEDSLDCVGNLNPKNKISIFEGKPGEGADGILVKYQYADDNQKFEHHLAWVHGGGAGLGVNVITRGYSNQTYGETLHDDKNILHDLEINYVYDQNDEDLLRKIEVTLVKVMLYKPQNSKHMTAYSTVLNYSCNVGKRK